MKYGYERGHPEDAPGTATFATPFVPAVRGGRAGVGGEAGWACEDELGAGRMGFFGSRGVCGRARGREW